MIYEPNLRHINLEGTWIWEDGKKIDLSGKVDELDENPELCIRGFHACLNLKDVFNNYDGVLGKDIVVHEVFLEQVSDERNKCDSRVVAKKITIGERIL